MKRILFYDNSVLDYFTKHNDPNLIIDYFDIEVQKIIHSMGFSFKNNPKLVKNIIPHHLHYPIDYFFNINEVTVKKDIPNHPLLGVIFDCYC